MLTLNCTGQGVIQFQPPTDGRAETPGLCNRRGPFFMQTVEDRFWSKVDKNGPSPNHRPELGPCHVWIGATRAEGYGAFKFRGKIAKAHRVSWILEEGEIPDGICVLHKCDNPPCVRHAHHFLGTRAENVADAVAKGRMVFHAPRNGHHLNSLKTHCPHGHHYDAVNTRTYSGKRNCRTCLNARGRQRRAERRKYGHSPIEVTTG